MKIKLGRYVNIILKNYSQHFVLRLQVHSFDPNLVIKNFLIKKKLNSNFGSA